MSVSVDQSTPEQQAPALVLEDRVPQALKLPRAVPGNEHIWHIYAVQVQAERRDAVVKSMQEQGIGVGVHYPVPIHLQGAYRSHGHRVGDFPMAERAAAEMISLPIYPELTVAQQEQVVAALKRALG